MRTQHNSYGTKSNDVGFKQSPPTLCSKTSIVLKNKVLLDKNDVS